MKKQISPEQTAPNIQEVLRLLAEIPERMDKLYEVLSEEQFDSPLGPGERKPSEVLAHVLNSEAITSQELLNYYKVRRHILLQVLEPLTEKKWSRLVREEKKARKESVYWQARGLALHELEHLLDLESRLSGNSYK